MKKLTDPWSEFRKLYPIGAVFKTNAEIVDPLKKGTLAKGSFVILKEINTDIKSFRFNKTSNVWILCEDQDKGLWNIKPYNLEKFIAPTGKKGRFKILAQDSMIEKHNKGGV